MENKIYLRKILLDTMDTYIRDAIGDEEALIPWLEEGMPDEYEDDVLTEIACNTEDFERIVGVFQKIVHYFEED